jgi:outer membrane receptor protein involved in Fe transport
MASLYDADSNQIYPNKNVKPTKAVHMVAGYDLMMTENAHLRAEVYYQYLYDVPVMDQAGNWFSALNFGGGFTTDSMVNKGTGRNYGIEFTLERYFTDDWFFMLTNSIYQSEYTTADRRTFNTRYNGNYATTIVGGKEFKVGKNKNNIFSITSRGNWAGGRRFTPIILDSSIAAGYEVFDETAIYSEKQMDYLRLDLQISFKRNKKKTTRTWKIDAQNITNRKNIYEKYFDAASGEIRTAYQMGFIPIISYKVEF